MFPKTDHSGSTKAQNIFSQEVETEQCSVGMDDTYIDNKIFIQKNALHIDKMCCIAEENRTPPHQALKVKLLTNFLFHNIQYFTYDYRLD